MEIKSICLNIKTSSFYNNSLSFASLKKVAIIAGLFLAIYGIYRLWSFKDNHPSLPKDWQNQRIHIGCSKVSQIFQEMFPKIKDFFPISSDREIKWLRDSRVILKDGRHLIPYPLQVKRADLLLAEAFLPQEMIHAHSCFSYNDYTGTGFERENVDKALAEAKRLGVTAIQSKCCMEGGNVLNTEKGFIVGYFSVILSLLSLLHQNYFDKNEIEKRKKQIKQPTDQFIRIARKIKLSKNLDISAAKTSMQQPLTEQDREIYKQDAQYWQTLWNITIRCMEEELASSVIIVKHNNFHIDLEMLALPNKRILMHSTDLAACLNEKKKRINLLSKNCDTAKSIEQENTKILRQQGFDIIHMPGCYNLGGRNGVYALNGILMQAGSKLVFCTNMLKANWQDMYDLALKITQVFKKLGIATIFIDNNGVIGGGIRCLSWDQCTLYDSRRLPMIQLPDDVLPDHFPTKVYVCSGSHQPSAALATIEEKAGVKTGHLWEWTLDVPFEGRLFTLSINGETKSFPLLPGQARYIHLDDVIS